MLKISRISFGGTAAIVTSMALIIGLDAVSASRKTMISALLIAAIADNLTDSLSVHIYQESERMEEREAFAGTLSNFIARLALCLSFVLLVALLPQAVAAGAALGWGMLLLGALSYFLALQRQQRPVPEIAKHLVIAIVVLLISRVVGYWINTQLGA